MNEAEEVLDQIRFAAAVSQHVSRVRLGDEEYFALVRSPLLECWGSSFTDRQTIYGLVVRRTFQPSGVKVL